MNWWIFRRRVHESWLIAVMSLAVVVGAFVAQFLKVEIFASYAWLVTAAALAVPAFWKRCMWMVVLVAFSGCLLGVWRGASERSSLVLYRPLVGKVVSLSGTLSDDVKKDTSGQMVMPLSHVMIGGHSLPGTVLATSGTKANPKRGDKVTVRGSLSDAFGSYAATLYRATITKVIEPEPGDVARKIRDWFGAAVHRAIPEPQASLGLGYLVGQKSALPADLTTALQIAGLTHVVVASGYNLTILVRLSRRLFARFSKYLAAMVTGMLIASFMAVTGLSPSMTRAGLVAGMSLAAWYYGRSFHPLVLLCFAAGATVLFNPAYAWNDLGWALSFTSFGGVMLVGPLLQRYFFGTKEPGTVRQILGETIAAHIVTAPLIVFVFGQLSNVAIFSNLLVLPFVPLAMLLTFIAGIGGLIVPGFATIVGLPATWLLGYMVNVTEYLAGLSWAQTIVHIGVPVLAGCYVVIILACVWLWHATKLNFRDTNVVE